MIKSVFISRDRANLRLLPKYLEQRNIRGIYHSLIDKKAITNQELPESEWHFFYSRTAVETYLSYYAKPGHLPKIACLGRSAAEVFLEKNIRPEFTGNGRPNETAEFFYPYIQSSSVLFLQAKVSRQSIQTYAGFPDQFKSVAIYSNDPKPASPEMAACDVLIFTSPMNVQGFHLKNNCLPSQTIISIGPSTTSSLREFGYTHVVECDGPYEEDIVKCIQRVSEIDGNK